MNVRTETIISIAKYILVTVAVLVSLVAFMVKSNDRHVCGFLPVGQDYLCYSYNINEIFENQGLAATFKYTDSIANRARYGVYHLAMHDVGHRVWKNAITLPEALATIPFTDYRPSEIWRYSGAMHAIFHEYFLLHADEEKLNEFVQISCGEYVKSLPSEHATNALATCLHGVGHGVMAYTHDFQKSLALCAGVELPVFCYEGIFMENALLNIPEYGALPPYELLPVCLTLTGDQASVCAKYTGYTEVVKSLAKEEEIDFQGALLICDEFLGTLRWDCVFMAVRDLLPMVFGSDAKAMITYCDTLLIPDACYAGVVDWVKRDALDDKGHSLERVCGLLEEGNYSWTCDKG